MQFFLCVKEFANDVFICYEDDSRLPSKPNVKYECKGWIDWPAFLGTKKE